MDLALANLLSPPVMFFVLGLLAAFGRSDLSVPEAVSKLMSLYLLLAIGYKGGVAAQSSGLTAEFAAMLAAGVAISFVMPLLVNQLFLRVAGLDAATAAATAAHYGSISIVTFVTALDFAERAGVAVSGHMVAVAAAMESPAILTGLLLAALATRAPAAAGAGPRTAAGAGAGPGAGPGGEAGGKAGRGTGVPGGLRPVAPPRFSLPPHLLREVFLNGSIVVLVGAFVIGAVTGDAGMRRLDTFVNGIFQGVLCLFLLDMGLLAARRLQRGGARMVRLAGAAALATGLCAAVGLGVGWLIGAGAGDIAVLTVLSASASYIAVPAAMRVALPEADPGAYLSASLGITFPLNLTIGIPLYFALAAAVA